MLEINSIFFSYRDKVVINDISFTIQKGENIAIIGESGCGKSTLLKLIYGLYDLNQGTITYNGKKIFGPKYNLIPGENNIKYLAQDFDLMPYTTVAENVGKFLSNTNPHFKKQRIEELLEIVEMSEYANVKAQFLSGGQQQRIALARTLAVEPEILLLDEPFSHIDNFRKNALRRNLFEYLKLKKITCIVATHDSNDTLSFADETIVLRNGALIAKLPSLDLYSKPIDKYVAALFGEINELSTAQLRNNDGQNRMLLLYPHQLKVDENGFLKVLVKKSYFKGSFFLIKAVSEGQVIFFEHPSALNTNQKVNLIEI